MDSKKGTIINIMEKLKKENNHFLKIFYFHILNLFLIFLAKQHLKFNKFVLVAWNSVSLKIMDFILFGALTVI